MEASTNGIWILDVQVAPLASSQKAEFSFCEWVSIEREVDLQRTHVTPSSRQLALEGGKT